MTGISAFRADDLRVKGRISVVMPCYNSEAHIDTAVQCVLQQTHSDVELIVIDDGSDDGTWHLLLRLVEQNPGRMKMLAQEHRGPYPARNLGLSHSTGEFVAFLDADDSWRQDCLEKLYRALNESTADIAYCGWQNVGHRSRNDPHIPPDYASGDLLEAFLRSCPWPIHAALVRYVVVQSLGGFSERLFTSMDYDFWLRTLTVTRKLVRVPEVLAYYHWHGAQISGNRRRQILNSIQVRHDFLAQNGKLVQHLPRARMRWLADGHLLRMAHQAYRRAELADSQQLFRLAAARRIGRLRDLPWLAAALLPSSAFRRIAASLVRWF